MGKTDYWLWGFVVFLVLLMGAIFYGTWQASIPRHEQTIAPDGKPALLVSCSSPSGCVRHAAEMCPRGYEVLHLREEHGQSTTYVNVGSGSSTSVGVPITSDTYDGAVLVRCK